MRFWGRNGGSQTRWPATMLPLILSRPACGASKCWFMRHLSEHMPSPPLPTDVSRHLAWESPGGEAHAPGSCLVRFAHSRSRDGWNDSNVRWFGKLEAKQGTHVSALAMCERSAGSSLAEPDEPDGPDGVGFGSFFFACTRGREDELASHRWTLCRTEHGLNAGVLRPALPVPVGLCGTRRPEWQHATPR
jgi:hypothetical protein